jgi:hypothetical protein
VTGWERLVERALAKLDLVGIYLGDVDLRQSATRLRAAADQLDRAADQRDVAAAPVAGEDAIARAADAILKNLRDRRLLKYLFHEEPDACVPYGYVEAPIDLETQRECAETLARLALAVLVAGPKQ